MNYDEFMRIIESASVEDWILNDEDGILVYKNNIAISIETVYTNEKFYEEWIECYSDKENTMKQPFKLCYMGHVVDTFYTASVDGARMNIPYPNREDMSITRRQYNIGRIVNKEECQVIDRYDEYLRKARIIVK